MGSVDGEYNEAPHAKTTEGDDLTVGDGSVDLKGRPVSKTKTGGWKTASLIFGKRASITFNRSGFTVSTLCLSP